MLPQLRDNLRGDGRQNAALYDPLREDYEPAGNMNAHALDVNSDAIATAVLKLGYDTSTVNGAPRQARQEQGAEQEQTSTRCGTRSTA